MQLCLARLRLVPVALTLATLACGSSKTSGGVSSGQQTGTSGATGSGSPGGGASGGGPTVMTTGPVPNVGVSVSQLASAPPTVLPTLPPLTNVVALQREDSVGIDFDPVDGAVDYRVYALPNDGDVTMNADGSVTAKNAIYRCAGLRQTFDVANNLDSDGGVTPQNADGSGVFTYDANGFAWKTSIPSNPTLGYVYTSSAPGSVPVYALAGYTLQVEVGWGESRLKVYTTDANQRASLIAQGWRDDGIAFYAPSTASSMTTTIYGSQTKQIPAGKTYTQYVQYYFDGSGVAAHMMDTAPPAPAFQVLSASAPGTQPLMAVDYAPGDNHIELAVGNERFKRAAYQGQGPLWHLEWSWPTAPAQTTLVVEALASGCPFQGFLSATHLAAPPHQTFFTLAELQAASPTGEVFVNGQFTGPSSPPLPLPASMTPGVLGPPRSGPLPWLTATTMSPKAIARSFVSVTPQPHNPADWDWYEGFPAGTDFGPVTALPKAGPECFPGSFVYVCGRWQTPIFDFSGYNLDGPNAQVLTYGQFLGQFWEAFDDTASDVIGRTRFTARTMGQVDPDPTKFFHATMSVDIVSTSRRYPQLIISDQPAPVQEGLDNPSNNTLLFQPIRGAAIRIEVQAIHGLVNGKHWDVNNQAPEHILVHSDFSNFPNVVAAPDPAIAEHTGVDRMTRFDVYVSSKRVYFFLDGLPAGCTQYPANGFSLQGPVSLTFGDVLYHEGALDELVCASEQPYPFLYERQCTETKRHFDDVGFKSSVPAPAWNEGVYPCGPY